MRLKLVPDVTTIDFMGKAKYAIGLSGIAIILAAISFFTLGLNFGIDFRGGTVIELRFPEIPDLSQIRAIVGGLDLGDVAVQEFGQPNEILIQLEASIVPEGALTPDLIVTNALAEVYPALEVRRVEFVGPKVSGELVQAGAIAITLAVLAVLIYIWLRFEWQFAVGAVAALVHDVVLTIGVFSEVQLEFNLSIIAAVLTIVGYSINDTVVVFDRVRENLRRYKSKPLAEVLNISINETLSRTLMTSGTTLIALLALYFLGGEVIRGFTFGMIWGIIVGTYSSIFIAAVVLLYLGVKRDWSKPDDAAGVQFGTSEAP
ncbi:MAG: protein translocase subunit SecF [Pseudomonadota bacterium]